MIVQPDGPPDVGALRIRELIWQWRERAVRGSFTGDAVIRCAEQLEALLAVLPAAPAPEAGAESLADQLGKALADMQNSPDCWCDGVNKHSIACKQAQAAQKRWMGVLSRPEGANNV